MTYQLQVNIPSKPALTYPITLGFGVIQQLNDIFDRFPAVKKVVIIADDIVADLYAKTVQAIVASRNLQSQLIIFSAGEAHKTAATKLQLEEEMFKFGCDRHTLCLALGGGVVGDIAGFTAATYMRGINYVQIPTSLLAMIDSSVGGKTAVNTSYGKNIIGAFWQPIAVLMDVEFLKSLPAEHLVNGLFEAIKIFLTLDHEHVNFCASHINEILNLEEQYLLPVINKAVSLKAYVVEVDEHERNLRMILNFGHTVGHALEKISNYKLLHGYGVGYGMLLEAKIAQIMGLLSGEDFNTVAKLLASLGINADYFNMVNVADVIINMRGDKKNANQQIKLVLLTGIGQVKNIDNQVAFDVDEAIIERAFNEIKLG